MNPIIHPSDTPPNGDFARYVERLTGANAVPGKREDLFQSRHDAPASESFAECSGTPSVQARPQPLTGVNFLQHAKWVVVAWIATQALAKLLPGAGFLFIPVLLGYAAWVIFKLNLNSSADLKKRWCELAKKAVEEAKKAQHSHKK